MCKSKFGKTFSREVIEVEIKCMSSSQTQMCCALGIGWRVSKKYITVSEMSLNTFVTEILYEDVRMNFFVVDWHLYLEYGEEGCL